MKRFLFALAVTAMLAPTAFAGDFDHGQTKDGCYLFSESGQTAYNLDASAITDVGHCSSTRSTLWYVKRDGRQMPDSYYNRIQALKVIIGK